MRLVNSSIVVIIVSALAAIAVNKYSHNTLNSANVEIAAELAAEKSYILQGGSAQYLNQLVNQVGGNVSREFPFINAVSAMLTSPQVDKIREMGGVRVQDDRTVITSSNSTAPGLLKKLRLNNYVVEQTGADRLHDMNIKGKGVTVAVVDSGANMWGPIGSSLFRDSRNKRRVSLKYDAFRGHPTYFYNDDQNGHGTHVAGLIASSYQDDEGNYNGIAPDVYLLSVKAFDSNGESSYSKVLDSLNWIFENRYEHKIRVVNMSLGATAQSNYWNDPINVAVMRLWDAGIVVISSAGNNGKDMGITVPGNNPYVITVGAATNNATPYDMSDDRLATFSSKGPTLEGFVKPEVLAYGAQVASRLDERFLRKLLKLSPVAENYSVVSGTSQAAAIVTGIAALVISNDPYVTPDEVKCRIMQTAVSARNDNMATYSPFEQGAGLVNAYSAVMSSATNCANTNLNIKEDLLDINHFVGPARTDANGNIVIDLQDGTILTEGMHWGNTEMAVNAMHWSNDTFTAGASQWLNNAVGSQSTDWSAEFMGVQGMHWGGEEMSLQGMHWGGQDMSVQGMHWGEYDMNLQSADLDIDPIDPTVEVPMQTQGWQ